MKKIAIFDLDGTLLNTLESISNCANLALEEFGLPTVDTKEFPSFIGHGADWLLDKLFTFINGDRTIFDTFRTYYLDLYNKKGSDGIAAYEGIYQLISALKQKGVKTAILSNKPHTIVVDAAKKYFDSDFDIVFGQRENVPVKPDPTMIYEILKKFNISPDECIYCGDSDVDIQTGKNSSVFTIGAAWGFYGDKPFADADAIAYNPTDILKYID